MNHRPLERRNTITHTPQAVIERIPPPPGDPTAPLRCRLVDSWYDETRGVVCLVQVVDGKIKEGDRISAISLGTLTFAHVFVRVLYALAYLVFVSAMGVCLTTQPQ